MDISIDRTLHISFPEAIDSSLHDITTGIEAGSATLSEVIISSGNISFGSYASNKFEILIYGISNVANEKIEVWIEDSSSTRTDIFTGYVDSCKLDNLGYYRQIVAYDQMYWSKDADVSLWWDSFWTVNTGAVPLRTIRNSLCDFIGIDYETSACYNDTLSIKHKEPGISGLKFSQILSAICELQCTFPNITREGELEFVSLDPAKVTSHNVVGNYEQGSSTFEDFQTAVIDRVEVFLDNELVYRTSTAGSNIYTIENNMLLYDYTTLEIESFANPYLLEASKVTYTPATVHFIVSDFSIALGDILTTENGSVYVLANEFSDSLLVDQIITATGDKYLSNNSSGYNVAYNSLSTKIADTITDLQTNYVRTELLDANVATLGYLKTENLDAEAASIGYLKTENLDAAVANVGYLKAATAELTYAHIDLANVNNAWITNGVIKNGAIVDAQIGNVSANKLTTGTLDASNIRVINLSADSITTGSLTVGGLTINVTQDTATLDGSAIEDGTITLSGFSQEVVDMIDGAIETFTATAVPTLSNYPASSWTTADERHTHIGDICYVVNAASSADGYCYRFTYDNTTRTYSWVLIKDSDVTKALQELIDVEGDISGLQSFQSTTTSWITNTDEELNSLKSRTTTVETNSVKSSTQLWFTKANSTAPNRPTSHVTSTSTAGNAWRIVVPAYNASYPYYFYCWEYQYVDNSYGWSAVVLDIAMGESQQQGRQGVSDAATAQETADKNVKKSTMLWFTKANTTAPNKPTSVVTSTSTAGNAWRVVVPIYNASYPYYYYCYQFELADGTYTWSDVVYDQATSETQANSRSALSQVATKVETSVFNQLSQTVDSNTASITALSSRVDTKADSSTVTTLSNTVNTIQQTVDSNTLSISNLTTTTEEITDELSGQANLIETTSVQVASLQQDLSGFQTTVSETYATTTDLESQISIVNSNLTQTSTSLIADFSSLSQTVNELTGEVSDAIAISKSIGFDDGDLVLYRSDSPNNVRLTTDELQFNYDTETVAKIYQNEGISLLEITNAEIKTTLSIGNFEFVPRASGNLSFRRRS